LINLISKVWLVFITSLFLEDLMTNEQKLKSSLVILKPTFMSDGKQKSKLNID